MSKEIIIAPPRVRRKDTGSPIYYLLQIKGDECLILSEKQYDFFKEIGESDEIILNTAEKIKYDQLSFVDPVTITIPNTNPNPTTLIIHTGGYFEKKEWNVLFLNGYGADSKERKEFASIIEKYSSSVFHPHLDYHEASTSTRLAELIMEKENINMIIGHSLGGLLGYYLSNKYQVPSLLFNPAFGEDTRLPLADQLKTYPVFADQYMVTGAKDTVVLPDAQLTAFQGQRKSTEPELGHDVPLELLDFYCRILLTPQEEVIDHDPVGVNLTDHPINIPPELSGKNIFYNSKIFITGTDYILGGFTADEINKVAVVGDASAVNYPKLKLLAEERLEKAIETFKAECRKNILAKTPLRPVAMIEQDIKDNLNNLMQTYLGLTIDTTDTDEVAEIIMNDSAYQTWLSRVENRIADFKRSYNYWPETINYTGPVKDGKTAIDIESAEENTKVCTLEQMMEALLGINEKNES